MLELILTRGIPASGKSTWAKAWVLSGKDRVRINRDDIRMQLFNKEFGVDEDAVTAVEDAMITAALKSGRSVVVDDCNIQRKYINRLSAIGHRYGASVRVVQFDIKLSDALDRNAKRDRVVPENIIRDMFKRLGADLSGSIESPLTVEKYVPKPGTRKAILVDLDGSLAHMNGRGPFEWLRVDEDDVDEGVLACINAMRDAGVEVIFLSGRDSAAREKTLFWLAMHGWEDATLHMRAAGDMRKDNIVKYELFDEHIRDEYNVLFVIDDRAQVVRLWKQLGLKTFNVSGLDDGEF